MSLSAACPAYRTYDPNNTNQRVSFQMGGQTPDKFLASCWRCYKTPPRLSQHAELCDSCIEELRAISPV